MARTFIFTSLAMNQTQFFAKIAQQLQSEGYQACVICFHERSADFLKQEGIPYFNVFDSIRRRGPIQNVDAEFEQLLEKFSIPNTHKIFNHEMSAFCIHSEKELKTKFIEYSLAVEECVRDFLKKSPPQDVVLIQELGGFSSLQSAFYVSRKLGMDHYFLEPAFFKGRCFLIPNSFSPLDIPNLSERVEAPVIQYLESAVANKKIVIPDKDKAHYLGLFAKVFRFYNFKRFVQKLADRFLFDKREEFRYIGTYVGRHLKMFWNRFLLNSHYQTVPENRFVYYPIHVPMDVALTLRAPACLDQYYLMDLIARSLPFGYKLAIKEHPAMVGVLDMPRLSKVLQEHKEKVVLLNPKINNFEVLSRTDLVVTVNSKSGAEAALLGQKVMVLGEAFYRNSPLFTRVDSFEHLDEQIAKMLKEPAVKNSETIRRYYQSVWDASFPGEIYSCDPEQIRNFSSQFVQLKPGGRIAN